MIRQFLFVVCISMYFIHSGLLPYPIKALERHPEYIHRKFQLTFSDLAEMVPEIEFQSQVQAYHFLDLAKNMLLLEPHYFFLVDKSHPLPLNYHPETLKILAPYGIKVKHPNLMLETRAHESLLNMSLHAKQDNIILEVISAYRSYHEQSNLFASYLKRYGEWAKLFSAPPGMSQHQLGTTVDFGTINNSFYETPESTWLQKHAETFGWSLSYPKNQIDITGYMWESWHWRWIGVDAVEMQNRFFDGSQQRMLEFWNKHEPALRASLRN